MEYNFFHNFFIIEKYNVNVNLKFTKILIFNFIFIKVNI